MILFSLLCLFSLHHHTLCQSVLCFITFFKLKMQFSKLESCTIALSIGSALNMCIPRCVCARACVCGWCVDSIQRCCEIVFIHDFLFFLRTILFWQCEIRFYSTFASALLYRRYCLRFERTLQDNHVKKNEMNRCRTFYRSHELEQENNFSKRRQKK